MFSRNFIIGAALFLIVCTLLMIYVAPPGLRNKPIPGFSNPEGASEDATYDTVPVPGTTLEELQRGAD